MKLLGGQLAPISLRLRTPLVTSRARYAARDGLRVELRGTSADGRSLVGEGEATPLVEFGTESLGECREALERAIAKLSALAALDSTDAVEATLGMLVPDDRTPTARFALEVALLDLLGQEQGLPIAQLLSPGARRWVAVSALLVLRKPAELAAEAADRVAEGYTTLKLKVGAGPLDDDLARLTAVREQVGPMVKLRVDANGVWSREEAERALTAFGPLQLELCEQPVAEADLEGLAAITAKRRCQIASDESLSRVMAEAAPASFADVWVMKPSVVGGLQRSLVQALRASELGVGVVVTSALDGRIARAAAAHLAAAIPRADFAAGLGVGDLFLDEPADPLRPVAGMIQLSRVAGLGLGARSDASVTGAVRERVAG